MNWVKLKANNKMVRIMKYMIAALVITLFVTTQAVIVNASAQQIKIPVYQYFYTNSVLQPDDASKYVFKPLNAASPLPAGSISGEYSFWLYGNDSHEIGPLDFNKQGVYHYQLYQQIVPPKHGYTYDNQVYTITAHVDSSLNVVLIVKKSDGNKTSDISFDNSYIVLPSNPALMADPPIIKTVVGGGPGNTEFTFKLAAMHMANPMPFGSVGQTKSVRIIGSGMGAFGTWVYDKAGTYVYMAYEMDEGAKGYEYDTRVYKITDKVTEYNGRLVVSRAVTRDDGTATGTLDFVNRYHSNEVVLGDDPVHKEGDTLFDCDKPRGSIPGVDTPVDAAVPGAGITGDDVTCSGNGDGANAGAPANGKRIGLFGPKTGDETDTILYISLFITGGVLVIGAAVCLIAAGKRKKASRHKSKV